MRRTLGPVNRRNITDEIVNRFRELIESGSLAPGDKLPSERELCEQLRCSRLAVREAIKQLAGLGWVEVRQGDGTYVRRAAPRDLVDPLVVRRLSEEGALLQLVEARKCLEVELAGLAAERATQEDLDKMQLYLDQMARDIEAGGDVYIDADVKFHMALVTAARNDILRRLYEGIVDLTVESRRLTSAAPGGPPRALAHHRAILDAIRARDPVAAREAMRNHLIQVEKDVITVMRGQGDKI